MWLPKKKRTKHVYVSEYEYRSYKEYVKLKAKRYRLLRRKKAKGQILNEVVETTGYDRKHAIRLLPRRRLGRPRKLTPEDIFVIKEIWKASKQP
jgi:hypothetical protein